MEIIVPKAERQENLALVEMIKQARDAVHVKEVLTTARQIRIGQAVKVLGLGTKHVDGLGPLRGAIDRHHYFKMIEQDPAYWQDPQNRKNYYKKNPAALVENWTGRTRSKFIGCSMHNLNNPRFHVGQAA